MGLSKSNPSVTPVKLLFSRPSGRRIPWQLLSWLALGSGTALLIAVIISGARLIVDPYGPNWLKTTFPGLTNSFEAVPQTADEIKADIRSQGLISGAPIAWPETSQPKAWFYPILGTDGRSIQQLWVYRIQGNRLQRVEQVAVRSLKESFITTPLVGTASQVASVDSDATLSSVSLMTGSSAARPWLLLEGQKRYGNTVMRYGQILNYQPDTYRLHRLLNWSSSTGQRPQWQHSRQLVIDQTVGLRPSFLLYRLVPSDPPKLQEISLYSTVYEPDDQTSLYDKALKLAQGAVWSHSLQMMQSAKEALGPDWSPEAETQLALIRLHAERTKAQTKQTWSHPQQHILAYLIDGQWAQALSTLENEPTLYDTVLKRIERDFDALWRGVTTHLQVHPKDAHAQLWGALLVTARQSPEIGEDWLTEKTPTKQTLERWQALNPDASEPVELAVADSSDQDSAAPATTLRKGQYVGLVGQAKAIGRPGNGWLRSQTLPAPVPGQTWYQIEAQLIQNSTGWGRPTSIDAANFWAESLSLRRQVQLFHNNQPTAGMTIHGVKAHGSGITLLAVGPQVEGTALAATANSLQWLSSLAWQPPPMPTEPAIEAQTTDAQITEAQTPEAQTTADIVQPETQIAETIGQQLGLTSEQTLQIYPHLHHARLDLIGGTNREHLITIGQNPLPDVNLPSGKTMIFSAAGELLYSDIDQQQSLLALIAKDTEQPAALLIEQSGRYTLTGL